MRASPCRVHGLEAVFPSQLAISGQSTHRAIHIDLRLRQLDKNCNNIFDAQVLVAYPFAMWLHYLLNLLASAASVFFNAIGATFLGVLVDVAFAGSVAFIALHKKRRDEGWGAMLNHWRKEYKAGIRFALLSALILYGPVIVWSVGKAVYEDHEGLVAAAAKYKQANINLTINAGGPKLKGEIEQVLVAPSGEKGENCLVTISMKIKNTGAPSIADILDFSMQKDGVTHKGATHPTVNSAPPYVRWRRRAFTFSCFPSRRLSSC